MFQLRVKGSFSSAHFLKNYNGKCENLHGHNYKVELFVLGTEVNETYMLEDFTILKRDLKEITEFLDHRNLNEIDFFEKRNPTAEMIALYIYENMKKKHENVNKVRIWETENQYAEYYQ